MKALSCPNCGHDVEVTVPEGTLGQTISTYDLDATPGEVASEILAEMLPEVPAAFLHGAVASAVRSRHHRAIRDKQRTLLGIERDWDRDVAARKAMLSLPLLLGDGTRVTWGQATWDQWAQRDQMLASVEAAVVRGVQQGRAVAQWALACRELNPDANCLAEVTIMPAPPRSTEADEESQPVAIESTVVEPKPARARKPRKMR